jgi:hypothetical protein
MAEVYQHWQARHRIAFGISVLHAAGSGQSYLAEYLLLQSLGLSDRNSL